MISVLKKRTQMLFMSALLAASMVVPAGVTPTYAAEPHADNPFVGATMYVNPDYANLIDTSIAQVTDSALADQMRTVKSYPTAVWLDRIDAIYGGDVNAGRRSLEEHLDLALAQKQANQPLVAMFVVYDLPGRDCHALASNGELPLSAEGLARYKTEYIDEIAKIFAKPKYQDIRIVNIIEPDSLPNLVTNLNDPKCAQADSTGIYVQATQYALNKLAAIPNVYNYMDIGHSGWLGWDNNMSGTVQLMTNVVGATTKGFGSINGFITNTANTSPLVEPNLPNPNLNINGSPIRSSSYYEWNPNFDEVDYTAALYSSFTNAGWPSTLGFLIDTSRNGWGGPNRPTTAVGNDINSYVNSGRVDRRAHRGLWCNNSGSGIGTPPQAAPAGYASSHLDAFVWVKPPGESDGSSSAIPNNEGKGFDRMCDPTYTTSANVPTGAMPNAPIAGHWFHDQFVMLVKNAYPVIPATPGGGPVAPAAPTGVTAVAGDSKVSLNWSPSSGATSYTVKRATVSGGPYTALSSTVTTASYADLTALNGITYYYVVSASNAVGTSGNSLQVSATPTETPVPTLPPAPTGLTATAGDAKVTLAWSPVSGATGYNVKRATVSGGPYTTVAPGLTTAGFTDTTVTNGTTYYYVASAVNAVGEGAHSTEASALPTGSSTGTGALAVQYKVGNSNATDNMITATFNIKNTGTTAINLSDLKLRYYLTKDGSASLNFYCDYAQIGSGNVSGAFVAVSPAKTGADTYLEISFAAGAGTIAAGGQSGDIQIRVAKSDWTNFDETNDYSFDGTKSAFADWNKVTLHQGSTLVWGLEP